MRGVERKEGGPCLHPPRHPGNEGETQVDQRRCSTIDAQAIVLPHLETQYSSRLGTFVDVVSGGTMQLLAVYMSSSVSTCWRRIEVSCPAAAAVVVVTIGISERRDKRAVGWESVTVVLRVNMTKTYPSLRDAHHQRCYVVITIIRRTSPIVVIKLSSHCFAVVMRGIERNEVIVFIILVILEMKERRHRRHCRCHPYTWTCRGS